MAHWVWPTVRHTKSPGLKNRSLIVFKKLQNNCSINGPATGALMIGYRICFFFQHGYFLGHLVYISFQIVNLIVKSIS